LPASTSHLIFHRYFSSLATASKAVPKMVPPTKQQLKQLHAQLASTPSLPLQAALDACNTAGVSSATSSKLASSIASPDGTVTTSELLVLLLAMTGTNLAAAVQGIFDIFGSSGQLSSAAFVELFGHLAQRDPDLGDASVASLEEALAGRESVSYSELCEDSPLKARLAVV
jgi:hypothetical protein